METALNKAEGKYLTFWLAKEEYGVEILKVREIIGLMEITAVPRAAQHIRGVINLRGKIVPVMDLRLKFGLPEAELKRENCIITVMIRNPRQEDVLLGLLADRVSEVMEVRGEDIDPVPPLGADLRLDFVLGLAKNQDKVRILLDIDKVVQQQDLQAMAELEQRVASVA